LHRATKLLLSQLLCAAIFFASGCDNQSTVDHNSARSADLGSKGRVLRRGLPGEPQTLDPQLADDTFSDQVVWDLYEGLTALDRDGTVTPGVAESWTTNPTGTTYTFSIRSNAKWSDGERVYAAEFVAGLRRAVDPRTASGSADLLSVIKNASEIIAGKKSVAELGVTAPSENSIRLELERPAPYILQILAEPIAAPFHQRHDTNGKSSSSANAMVTDGPYVLASRVPNSYLDLTRNTYYWDAEHVAVDKIRYVNAESEATELREYVAGDLDLTYTVPTPDLTRVKRDFADQLQTSPILGTLYLALDVSEPPLRDNRDLRQALSMSIDRSFIAEHLTLGVTPAYSFVAHGIRDYEPPSYQWASWPRDQQLSYARGLYARSGYSHANPLHLKLYFNSGEGIQRIMVAVAGGWKQNLGVETTLLSDEFRVFLNGRKDHSRWDVARLGWWADYNDPSSFLEIFSRTSGQNDPVYRSSVFNSLLDSARADADANERLMFLRKSEEVLLNDYPIIPIYFYTAARLVKPYVGGAEISALRRTYSKHLYWRGASQAAPPRGTSH
jgi:oligopeptide transport system substrate-binding protein